MSTRTFSRASSAYNRALESFDRALQLGWRPCIGGYRKGEIDILRGLHPSWIVKLRGSSSFRRPLSMKRWTLRRLPMFSVIDVGSGLALPLTDKYEWALWHAGIGIVPMTWELRIVHSLPGGAVAGTTCTNIFVSRTGAIQWEGRKFAPFPTPQEAKDFVEATCRLEETNEP